MVRFMPVLTVRGCGWIAKCEIRARTLWSGRWRGRDAPDVWRQRNASFARHHQGTVSTNRAATPCNCQGTGAGGSGARSRRRRPRGTFSANRAATPCNCQGTAAGGWGARSCRRRARGVFSTNHAATLCNCLLADAGGWGVAVSAEGACGAIPTNRAATLCNRQGIGAGGWGAVMPVEVPLCVLDKSRNYPVQLSGGRCRQVNAGSGRSSTFDRAGRSGRGCDRLNSGRIP